MQPRSSDASRLPPREWFALMHQKHGGNRPFDVPRNVLDKFIERIPAVDRDEARNVWEARYQMSWAEIHDDLIQQYLQQIIPVLNQQESKIIGDTYIGILETTDFEGYAGFTPRGDRVIVLHQGLGNTINFWAHWMARAIAEEGGHDYLNDDDPQLLYALEFILRAWNNKLSTNMRVPDIFGKQQDTWQLADVLTIAAMAFVIGHELGHIILGHSGYGSNADLNHQMEYAADEIGLSVCLRHALFKAPHMPDNYFTKFMLSAPFFTLAFISFIGDKGSTTHPPASERGDRLRAIYERELRKILKGNVATVIAAIDEDLLRIIEKNSLTIFDWFAYYRARANEVRLSVSAGDKDWLRTELTASRQK